MSKAATAEALPTDSIRPEKGMMLPPDRLADPDFGWRTWEATIPLNVPLEWVGQSWFWRLNARRLRRGDHVKWRNDSLTLFGELVIVAVDVATGNIVTRELWKRDVAPTDAKESEKLGFTPKDNGVHDKWSIIRDADGHVMAKGIESYDEAMLRIRTEHVPRVTGRYSPHDKTQKAGTIGGKS